MIALANDARMNAGKPALGFLNPFIYQNPQIFYDITVGNNQACWVSNNFGTLAVVLLFLKANYPDLSKSMPCRLQQAT